LANVSAEIDAIENKALAYGDEGKPRAGALGTVSYDGSIRIECGLVLKGDARAAKPAGQGTASEDIGDAESEAKGLAVSDLRSLRITTAVIQAAMTG
jgi:hypothetical protein